MSIDTVTDRVTGRVTDRVTDQTHAIAGDARQHVRSVVDQARSEMHGQLEQRGQQLTDGLNSLASQLRGLRSGQPDQAGALQHYVSEAEQRLSGWADRLQRGGPDQAVADVRRMARARPGTFLLGALGAGFVAGRLVRIGIAASHDTTGSATGTMEPGSSPAIGGQVQTGLAADGMTPRLATTADPAMSSGAIA
jgi:hypothetical protein